MAAHDDGWWGALPSIASQGALTDVQLREAVPGWLCEAHVALQRRGVLVRCLVTLLSVVFPGANRHDTSVRVLYADLLRKGGQVRTPAAPIMPPQTPSLFSPS